MDEVSDHVEALAIDPLLARVMEVELHQIVALAGNQDRASGVDVDLDRVPVVDDVQRARLVAKDDRWDLPDADIMGADVDRRLVSTGTASGISGIELAPMRRPLVAGISPMVRAVRFDCAGCRQAAAGGENRSEQNRISHSKSPASCRAQARAPLVLRARTRFVPKDNPPVAGRRWSTAMLVTAITCDPNDR